MKYCNHLGKDHVLKTIENHVFSTAEGQLLFSGNKSFRTSCLRMKSVLQILIFESIMTYKN